MRVDLNSDLGEGFGIYQVGDDEQMLELVTSANLACGFHAGDPMVMDRLVPQVLRRQVAVGAHPGFPDQMGFGRRPMDLSIAEIRSYTMYQIGALQGFVRAYGGRLSHAKAHGALYNLAADDQSIAQAFVEGVARIDSQLLILGLPFSAMEAAAKEKGLDFAAEVFADRAYDRRGRLLARTLPGAVLSDPEQVTQRVLTMIHRQVVPTVDGAELPLRLDSICLHGDTPKAVGMARKLRQALHLAGVQVLPFREG